MISLVRYLEVQSMEGQKRQHRSINNNPLNFVPEDEENSRRNISLGIRSEILKDEVGGTPAEDHTSSYGGYGEEEEEDCDVVVGHVGHAKSFKEYEGVENDSTAAAIPGSFENLLGPGDSRGNYRRQLMSQWNSESLSELSEKYKRSISSSSAGAGASGGAGTAEEEERRVRSRPDQASSVVLTNLLGRSREETDLHMNISARTLRPSGGKDRHSKVFTAKGPRDRRVRLSVSTAIQFYDVQDRLGYDQPSKAVEWLMKKAKTAIDELSQIPLPGIDRLVPSSSMYHHHHAYGSYNQQQPSSMDHDHQVYNPCTTSYSSSGASELQLKGVTQGCSELLENSNLHQSSPAAAAAAAPEMKAVGGRSELQAVDESDGFASRHAISGISSSTRRGELATDITMSVGGEAPSRSNQVQGGGAHHHHHHHHPHSAAAAAAGLSSFSSPPLAQMMNTSLHHHRQGLQLQQQSRAGHYLYEDALANSAASQRLLHQYNQQQASLIAVQQNYLQLQHQQQQQQQEFFQNPGSGSGVLPVGMASPSQQAKPYLDQFHSLKIQTSGGGTGAEKAGISSSASSSGAVRFGSFLGSSPGVYSSQNLKPPQPQQQQGHSVGGFAAENSQLIQSLEEHLRGGNTKRD